MNYGLIDFDVRNSVAWITLNRPDAFNALNLDCMKELCDIANRCGLDRTIRAAVITGAGKAFCAGGDVHEFAQDPSRVDALLKELTGYLHIAISRFAWMDAPLIAAVNGVAAGAGLSLTAACDLVIAADTARFTSAYTQIGLSPDGGSTYYLSRLIGTRRAMELYLTNRTLSAQEALDWGLVNQVTPAGTLMSTATALAERLAQGPTRAYGVVKQLVLMAHNDSLESQMERESREIAPLSRSPDGVEGVRAFFQKRKPVFTGLR